MVFTEVPINSKNEKLVINMVKETMPKKSGTRKKTAASKPKKKKLYTVIFFQKWCKSCGLCSALCPKKIIKLDDIGHPAINDMDSCSGCRFCEIHCPDFAITIKERHPGRRRTNGKH